MPIFHIQVNGKTRQVDADPDTPLLWILRDWLGMTGTKYGCGVGICGACTILQGDEAVRACQTPVSEASGKAFTTIEGLAVGRELHACQAAWIAEDVSQCGYCQAGMIMTAAALLSRTANPSDEEIDAAMSDSVCRCGTYQRMRRAIHRAARAGTAAGGRP